MNIVLVWRWVRGHLPRFGQKTGYVFPIPGETYRSYMNYVRAVGGISGYAYCPDHWKFYVDGKNPGFEEPMPGLRR